LTIDLSLSEVARGKVMVAARQGVPIPLGWALDRDGMPTTDANAALTGSMLPMGGSKGAMLALMVELLACALTGAAFSRRILFLSMKATGPGWARRFWSSTPMHWRGGMFTSNASRRWLRPCWTIRVFVCPAFAARRSQPPRRGKVWRLRRRWPTSSRDSPRIDRGRPAARMRGAVGHAGGSLSAPG
jgi:hypothetical protein